MCLNGDDIASIGIASDTAIDLSAMGLSLGVDVAFAAFQYFVLQPLINGIFDQPSIGTFRTGINHLRFEAISANDAASWNATHDAQHQIAANTKLSLIGHNSLMQRALFSFKDPGVDSQLALAINLSALSTPWLRYAAYQPFGDNTDPYLACVDKNGHCKDGSPTHKSDAVITLEISDNKPSATKDFNSRYSSIIYQEAGLTGLATDRLLAAPSFSLPPTNLNLSSASQIRPMPSLASAKVVPSPLVINSGQSLSQAY